MSLRVLLFLVCATVAPAFADAPAACPHHAAAGASAEPLFAQLKIERLDRLRADFSEEKHIALLAKPLRSSGRLYFDKARGMARVVLAPSKERVTLSSTTLRLEKAGHVEEVPLERSRSLRSFATLIPAVFGGDRQALEGPFDLGLDGDPKASWTLTLWPKDADLCAILRRVVVTGQASEVTGVRVEEASGDTTDTRFTGTARNDAVPAAEIAEAFGAK